jgi:hypothetical protein
VEVRILAAGETMALDGLEAARRTASASGPSTLTPRGESR